MVQQFRWTGGDTYLQGDSDWAGDPQDMKSTSGGEIIWGGQCIKGLVVFAICIGFELQRSRVVRCDKSGSSAQWRNHHG